MPYKQECRSLDERDVGIDTVYCWAPRNVNSGSYSITTNSHQKLIFLLIGDMVFVVLHVTKFPWWWQERHNVMGRVDFPKAEVFGDHALKSQHSKFGGEWLALQGPLRWNEKALQVN